MKKVIILLSIFSASFAQAAQVASSASPTSVHIFPHNGIFVFYAPVTSGEAPTCSGAGRWAIKTDAPGAKELVSMVLAAKASGRTITVNGTGTCDSSGFGYKVSYLYLN